LEPGTRNPELSYSVKLAIKKEVGYEPRFFKPRRRRDAENFSAPPRPSGKNDAG